MDKSTLFEEIRIRLKEPQLSTVNDPWTYTDEELVLHVRSAIRWTKINLTIETDVEMDLAGVLLPEPSLSVGQLLALKVASQLLKSDMISRLNSGSMGIYFRQGDQIIDTKTVAGTFKEAARSYDNELENLIMVLLSDGSRTAGSTVFGGPTLSI